MGWGRRIKRLFGNGAAPEPAAPPAAPSAPPAPSAGPRTGFDPDSLAVDAVPAAARATLRKILDQIVVIEGRLESDPFGCAAAIELAQMRDDHLPKLIRSYIEIPAEFRKEIFRKTGKSASFVLEESLATMLGRLEDMARDLARGDLEAFTENTRFIAGRYGGADDPFS